MRVSDFLRDMAKVAGFGATFASIPLLASTANLQPPWPTSVAYISAALILVGALIAWDFGEQMSRKTRQRLLLLAAALMTAGLFTYLYFYSILVLPLSGDGERLILGFSCNEVAQQLYPSRCPYLTELEVARAGYDLTLLYTPGSLAAAKLLLVAAWILFTAGLMGAVAWAIAGPKPPKDPPPAPPEATS